MGPFAMGLIMPVVLGLLEPPQAASASAELMAASAIDRRRWFMSSGVVIQGRRLRGDNRVISL
jgi:hypothetical protein